MYDFSYKLYNITVLQTCENRGKISAGFLNFYEKHYGLDFWTFQYQTRECQWNNEHNNILRTYSADNYFQSK